MDTRDRRRWSESLVLVVLGAGMLLGPMVASAMAQTVPTITSTTTTTTERTTTTKRPTTTTSEAPTTTRPAPTTTAGGSTTPTTASTTSTTAADGATTSSVGDSTTTTTTTTVQDGEIDPITNRQFVPTTTVPVGLDVGNPARISPIFPWLSVLGFLAAIGILASQYFLTGRRS